MIYERVNWLNKGETGAKPINKTNLNQMDKGIYDLQNIELIAVEKNAPTECTTGDKYFNTTDNLIYTATSDNTWGETGETPLRGILYVVVPTQTSYYYDGTTLISIGGGNGGTSIPVSATPPSEPQENDLWIDTSEEGLLATVDQEVSDTSSNAVSNKAITNYVNGINTYSTEEQVIGTWLGKPLYRKVYTTYTEQSGTDVRLIVIDTDMTKEPIKVYGSLNMLGTLMTFPTPDAGFGMISGIDKNSSGQLYLTMSNINTAINNFECAMLYTKTTATTQSEEV